MSATTAPIAIFGDLEAGLWGSCVGGEQPRLAVAGLDGRRRELAAGRPRPRGRRDLDAHRRRLRAAARACGCDHRDGGGSHGLEPCRVTGAATFEGVEREFDIGGRAQRRRSYSTTDSIRCSPLVPRRARDRGALHAPEGREGAGSRRIAVVARGEEHPLVFDPRLSTTYDHAGDRAALASSCGSETTSEGDLWPRRVAGGSHRFPRRRRRGFQRLRVRMHEPRRARRRDLRAGPPGLTGVTVRRPVAFQRLRDQFSLPSRSQQ